MVDFSVVSPAVCVMFSAVVNGFLAVKRDALNSKAVTVPTPGLITKLPVSVTVSYSNPAFFAKTIVPSPTYKPPPDDIAYRL